MHVCLKQHQQLTHRCFLWLSYPVLPLLPCVHLQSATPSGQTGSLYARLSLIGSSVFFAGVTNYVHLCSPTIWLLPHHRSLTQSRTGAGACCLETSHKHTKELSLHVRLQTTTTPGLVAVVIL